MFVCVCFKLVIKKKYKEKEVSLLLSNKVSNFISDFLPFCLFFNSLKESCLLHEVLKKFVLPKEKGKGDSSITGYLCIWTQ